MKKSLHLLSLLRRFCAFSVLALTVSAILPSVYANAEPVKSSAVQQQIKVNINTATAVELSEKLLGIGETKATAIVEFRQKHGKFRTVDEITEVNGIGESTYLKNKERITL